MSQNKEKKPGTEERKTAIFLVGIIIGMIGLSFASVPLYRIFCQKTGFGGTTQVATAFAKEIRDRTFTVRFNADVSSDLPWSFEPLQKEIKVKAGETAFALYHVVNNSNEPLIGMSTYNVTPDKAGGYFNKVECFCFLEQRLEPHESVDMPLLFFIDPSVTEDKNMYDVDTITLSYTFFHYKKGDLSKIKGIQTHRYDLS